MLESKYSNRFITKLVSIFANVEKRREEREESLALILAPSWARKHRHLWAQIIVYVRRSRKEKNKTYHIIIKKIFL
jgi:hypothetical protein